MNRPLTGKQAAKLLHIAKHGYCADRAVCRTLLKRGLIHESLRRYERHEWGRKVSSIACYSLSAEGERIVREDGDALRALRKAYWESIAGG